VYPIEQNFSPSTKSENYPLCFGHKLLVGAKKIVYSKAIFIFRGVGLKPHAFFVSGVIKT
jgi:hypothetical protein